MALVTPEAFVQGLSVLAAAIAMLCAFGVGIGQGIATGKAVESVARQPEAQGDVFKILIVGLGMAETATIFAFVVAIIVLFANPFV